MVKQLITYLFSLLCLSLTAQQNTLFMNSFFKDRLLAGGKDTHYVGNDFFPVYESEFDLNRINRDSSVQYYALTEILFKKHLIEVKGEDYYITISPVADLSLGKDMSDTISRRLFQNTRGVIVEGDLLNNFSFTTSFYENQGRYSSYETAYFSSIGELYPNQGNGTYTTQNAVIPGAARTKPFATDGFDYAYATGNIVYKPFRSLTICAGNTSHFIGEGYRSLLLSDNALPAPFLRMDYRITDRIRFTYLRSRYLNLMRKPVSSSVEAYYEPKAMSVNYLTYIAAKGLSISLFEGTIWSKGDSITSRHVHPLFYSPVPGITGFAVEDSLANSILGLNISQVISEKHRLYAQVATSASSFNSIALQFGYRGYHLFGMKGSMIQIEYNYVSEDMYSSSNRRLSYSHGNLPIAHVKGNDFQEVILRYNIEYKRLYGELKTDLYLLDGYRPLSLLPVHKITPEETGDLFLQGLEVGYRFNRKMNLCVFAAWMYRHTTNGSVRDNNLLQFGLKTGIFNRYTDF